MTDEALISRFQEGSEAAFEQIIRQWEGRMLNFFYRAVGDLDTAKDLRQELFFRLYTRGGTYRGKGSFAAWLYSIATNLLRVHFNKAKAHALAREADPEGEPEAVEPPDNAPTADEVARRNERARLVRELLGDLSPRDREVLMLRFFGHLRFEEVATVLGIRTGAARLRAIRAMERLRRMIAERGFTAGDLL